MARGQRKSLEEKITDKEDLISSLQVRIRSEQNELETLYNEKKLKDLEGIDEMIRSSGLNGEEVAEALEAFLRLRQQDAS